MCCRTFLLWDRLIVHNAASNLIRKLWQYCNVLRDDGLSYPDYVEQLTYLLFLKMSDEQKNGPVPTQYGWRALIELNAKSMHEQYSRNLAALGERDGMLGLIFRNAKNKIPDPSKLRLLIVDLIGQTEWTGLSTDIKGDAYEGLLEKNARDTKTGAGQYFTPRPLIEAIVKCVDPRPGEAICDPACGTGGFLLAAHEHLRRCYPRMTTTQRQHLSTKAIRGVELVEAVARLATMNLLLHGISGNKEDELPIACRDSLREPPLAHVDVVLTNPPFGVKGSVTYSRERRSQGDEDGLTVIRPDFWVQTANKQLNFLQHVITLMKPGGRAAVVIPDNVLFEGGAAASIRRRLMESFEVHTLLRLPPGLFYAQGVQANVLFFDRPPRNSTAKISPRFLWVYDLRSENRFSLKTNPLRSEDLQEFVEVYRPGARHERKAKLRSAKALHRWLKFEVKSILQTEDAKLDISWGTGRAPERVRGLSRLDEISNLIGNDLRHALEQISKIAPLK